MRVVIFGGTGFVGEYLCQEIKKEYKDILVIHSSELSEEDKIDGLDYAKIDLGKDARLLSDIIKGGDSIIFSIPPDIERMKNVISAISSVKDIGRIIYLSSLLVYGDSLKKQNEDILLNPETNYEKLKYAEENLLTNFTKKYNIKFTIARLGNVYGGLKNRGILYYIFSSVYDNKPLTVNGDGKQIRDYIFAEDVARYVVGLLRLDWENMFSVYNVCSGVGYSILDLIGFVEKEIHRKLEYEFGPEAKEKGIIIGDSAKIQNHTGIGLIYDMKSGIKKMNFNYKNKFK